MSQTKQWTAKELAQEYAENLEQSTRSPSFSSPAFRPSPPSAAADVIFNTFVDLVTERAQLAVISAIKLATTEESHAPGCPQLERDGTGHKSND